MKIRIRRTDNPADKKWLDANSASLMKAFPSGARFGADVVMSQGTHRTFKWVLFGYTSPRDPWQEGRPSRVVLSGPLLDQDAVGNSVTEGFEPATDEVSQPIIKELLACGYLVAV